MASGVQGQQPVGFPFFGVAGWDGIAWLEFFEGAAGGPVTTLWLGHRRASMREWLLVGTAPEESTADLAYGAALTLTESVRPDPAAVPLPPAFSLVQLERVREVAAGYGSWSVLPCEVDGREAELRYWRFAGGWCGFVGDSRIKVVGLGIGPEGLRLATVADPGVYGFDPSRPMHLSQLGTERREMFWATSLHPDQEELLSRAER